MSTFTMELNEVIESLYNDSIDPDEYEQAYDSVTFDGITYGKLPVLKDYTPLGLGTYPIFDEGYRAILNGKIIDEYWNQEIGTETIDNFVLILRKKMDQIMPYYNELYATKKLDYDPLSTMRIHSVGKNILNGTETTEATNTTETETKSGSRATNLNFPQTALAGDADYATSAIDTASKSDVDGNSVQNGETSSNSESNSDNLVTGYQGNVSTLMMSYRASLINIDTMIIADLADCFMQLLNNGDEYFASESRYGWF